MQVNGVNHINIVASDLAKTVAFYESVLGMKAQPIPVVMPGFNGRWIFRQSGPADHPCPGLQSGAARRTPERADRIDRSCLR